MPVRRIHDRRFIANICAVLLLFSFTPERRSFAQSNASFQYDTTLYNKMQWREIGPFRAGRSVAVAGHPGLPYTFYFGATGGGVWKTDDGGNTWINVSDGFLKVGIVGALAVAESDPNVLFAGTGESCIRGNAMPGDSKR